MRADIYLYTTRNAKSRQNAKVLIDGGNVIIDGIKISKPAQEIDESAEHTVEIVDKPRFVSRGGEKLDFALKSFAIEVKDLSCIDIGASTGGFTDCLLQRGAAYVCAVDSGHSQLDISIQNNSKVTSIEKYNARFIKAEDFDREFDIAVMDVSFISQTLIHSGIRSILKENGILISLIKPQFECGKSALNSHGVVKKASFHAQAINSVIDNALINGFSCIDLIRSPIEGGSGNVEFLAYFRRSADPQNHVSEQKISIISKTK